ncbi:MAG: hypothetical protein K0R07_25 [Sedimentibacter sp.]|jgi:hypothetical protein|nr:hypothetical protein [Sedimentibacter sp.]
MGKLIKLNFADGTPFLVNTDTIRIVKIVVGNEKSKSSINLVGNENSIPVQQTMEEIEGLAKN